MAVLFRASSQPYQISKVSSKIRPYLVYGVGQHSSLTAILRIEPSRTDFTVLEDRH